MNVEYTRQAVADLRKIAADSKTYGSVVATAVEARIRRVIAQIAEHPNSAPDVEERPGVHVISLIRFPYKIFYRILPDGVRILHIRHTARRPWTARP